VEIKNSNVKLKAAYTDNLTNYKRDIPQLFITNAFCVLSNAVETRLGSITGQWEHGWGASPGSGNTFLAGCG
jgi:type I restriction enzyme R subunit